MAVEVLDRFIAVKISRYILWGDFVQIAEYSFSAVFKSIFDDTDADENLHRGGSGHGDAIDFSVVVDPVAKAQHVLASDHV